MKEKSVLINISRGGVIDEQALIAALKRNQIWGAALDVFEKEPLSAASPLWQFKNVIITPHNSFVSGHNNERMFKLILKNLSAFLNKRRFLRSRME
jgi:phosphoglycerate dehydrogenase-like enzyme